jgi:ketosteroid isomerase-like protein
VSHTVLLLLLGSVVGCDGAGEAGPAIGQQAVDQLLARDAEFAARAYSTGVAEAYREFLADDAVQLPDGGYPIAGKQAIYENILATLGDAEITLTWEAEAGVVAASGDLGYTWGRYFAEGRDDAGEPFSSEGKYVNIWRRTGGEWRVALDISNQNEVLFLDEIDEPVPDAEAAADESSPGVNDDAALF